MSTVKNAPPAAKPKPRKTPKATSPKKPPAKNSSSKSPAKASTGSKAPSPSRDTTDVSSAKEAKVRPQTDSLVSSIKDDLAEEQSAAARGVERRTPDERRTSDRRTSNEGVSPTGVERRESAERRVDSERRADGERRTNESQSPGEEFNIEKNSLDLTKRLSVGGIKRAIDFMANEKGESTDLNFHLEGAGRVNGALKVGGWGDLGLSVAKTNQEGITLGFNYEAAVKAGLDLKFMKLGGAVGVKGAMQARFKDSGQAAAWLTQGLDAFDKKSGGGLLDIQKQEFTYNDPTTVKANGVFAKATASTKFGPFELSGEGGLETINKTYIEADGTAHKGRETNITAGLNRKLPVGAFEYDVNYKYKHSTVVGDVNEHNNGTFDNHQLGIQLSVSKLKKMSPEQIKGTLVGLSMMSGESALGQKAIESMVKNIDTILKNPASKGAKGSLGLRFEARNILEDGEMRNQYKRMFLDLGAEYGGKANLGLVEGEARTSVKKSELITEKIGNDTDTYVRQTREAMNKKGNTDRWDDYKVKNLAALSRIAQAHARKYPNPAITEALEKGDQSAAVEAMETAWNAQEQKADELARENKKLIADSKKLASYGDQFHLSNGEEAKMLKMLRSYDGNWEQMNTLFDKMEDQGIDRSKLLNKTGGFWSTHDEELKGYYDLTRQWKRNRANAS